MPNYMTLRWYLYCDILPIEINSKIKHNFFHYLKMLLNSVCVNYESVIQEFESC